ncbi:unnamed protein product [Amoebophrya sp. A120]|nr:unnamed protein product [Amoebophrya sp. A120]|eukprot:GSA120T00020899001.1
MLAAKQKTIAQLGRALLRGNVGDGLALLQKNAQHASGREAACVFSLAVRTKDWVAAAEVLELAVGASIKEPPHAPRSVSAGPKNKFTFRARQEEWELLVTELARLWDGKRAEKIFQIGIEKLKLQQPGIGVKVALLRAFGLVGDWQSAARLFYQWQAESYNPPCKITADTRSCALTAPEPDSQTSMDYDVKTSTSHHESCQYLLSAFLSALERGNAPDGITQQFVSQLLSYEKTTTERFLKARSKGEAVVHLPTRSSTAGRLDIVAYSAILRVFEKRPDLEGMMEIWNKIPVEKDAISYNIALSCVCRTMYHMVGVLEQDGCTLDQDGHCLDENITADGANYSGAPSSCHGLLSSDTASNLKHRQHLLTTAEKFLVEMSESDAKNIKKTAVTLNTAVRICELAEEPERGLKWISRYFLREVGSANGGGMDESWFRRQNKEDLADAVLQSSTQATVSASPFASARPATITAELLAQVSERLESGMMESTKASVGWWGNQNHLHSTTSFVREPHDPQVRNSDGNASGELEKNASVMHSRYHYDIHTTDLPFLNRVQNTLAARLEDWEKTGKALQVLEGALADAALLAPNWKLVPYGSLYCGTAGRGADLDVTLVRAKNQKQEVVQADESKSNASSVEAHSAPTRENFTALAQLYPDQLQGEKAKLRHLHHTRDQQQRVLLKCVTALRQNSRILHVDARLGGRVPVASFQVLVPQAEDKCDFAEEFVSTVDLTVDNTHALEKTAFLRKHFGNKNSEETTSAGLLAVLVKQWAKQEKIFGQTHGMLGGYAFSLLVVHYIRAVLFNQTNENFAANKHLLVPRITIGFSPRLFHGFFHYFAHEHDWNRGEKISFTHEQTYSDGGATTLPGCKMQKEYSGRPSLVLMDPVETGWNLGNILDADRLARTRAAFSRAAEDGTEIGWQVLQRARVET